jgi:hypothetical protein
MVLNFQSIPNPFWTSQLGLKYDKILILDFGGKYFSLMVAGMGVGKQKQNLITHCNIHRVKLGLQPNRQ